ncbi:hypothetical protein L596_029598 [Steinernema carpocapsae]|uniref:Uncharacterized protein n=1 Tax=Steinernema carpocapsae TaxID=34508 RepID=A0A4U5LV45_STECR|nr:hypothetical protein L596_029598 [Steinernema carpocapsae]
MITHLSRFFVDPEAEHVVQRHSHHLPSNEEEHKSDDYPSSCHLKSRFLGILSNGSNLLVVHGLHGGSTPQPLPENSP